MNGWIWVKPYEKEGWGDASLKPFGTSMDYDKNDKSLKWLGPIHHPQYGLGWKMIRMEGNESKKKFISFYDEPSTLIQEIMAANWEKENKK